MKMTLEDMSTTKLVELFADNCRQQDSALLRDDISGFNRLFDGMVAIDDELRRRGTDARLNLNKLFDHENMQVRLQAARLTFGVAPYEAPRNQWLVSEAQQGF